MNFEEKIIACAAVPSAKDWLVLVTKQEVTLMELVRPHGLQEKACTQHEEIEDEVHQMVVTVGERNSYLEIVILHDHFSLLKLVLNL